ncbi:MAG: hypothetical protein ACREL7_12890 [Longimicrobiales bacterium]
MTRKRVVLLFAVFALLAFGIGAGWQFTQARAARAERDAAQQQVAQLERETAVHRAEGALAAATIATQLGSFERGRVFASEFFTALQENADTASSLADPQVQSFLALRDQTITALSRAEPGTAVELARMFVRFRSATGGDPGIIELTPVRLAPDTGGTSPPAR